MPLPADQPRPSTSTIFIVPGSPCELNPILENLIPSNMFQVPSKCPGLQNASLSLIYTETLDSGMQMPIAYLTGKSIGHLTFHMGQGNMTEMAFLFRKFFKLQYTCQCLLLSFLPLQHAIYQLVLSLLLFGCRHLYSVCACDICKYVLVWGWRLEEHISVLFYHSDLIFCFSLNLTLAVLARLADQGVPSHWGYQHIWPCLAFVWVLGI